MTLRHRHLRTPIGPLLLVADGDALSLVELPHRGRPVPPPTASVRDDDALAPAVAQLQEYFAGERTRFDLALARHGTPFQRKVWNALKRIPYGRVVTYGDIARRIGSPMAFRAVGSANGANPLSIVVPCHRVVASGGRIGGYGGGLAAKRSLLALEGFDPRTLRH